LWFVHSFRRARHVLEPSPPFFFVENEPSPFDFTLQLPTTLCFLSLLLRPGPHHPLSSYLAAAKGWLGEALSSQAAAAGNPSTSADRCGAARGCRCRGADIFATEDIGPLGGDSGFGGYGMAP
jgi:hypothetical protein